MNLTNCVGRIIYGFLLNSTITALLIKVSSAEPVVHVGTVSVALSNKLAHFSCALPHTNPGFFSVGWGSGPPLSAPPIDLFIPAEPAEGPYWLLSLHHIP